MLVFITEMAWPVGMLDRLSSANAFIVATFAEVPETAAVPLGEIPNELKIGLAQTLASGRRVQPQEPLDIRPVTDNGKVFSVLFSDAETRFRRYLAGPFPPHVLVN